MSLCRICGYSINPQYHIKCENLEAAQDCPKYHERLTEIERKEQSKMAGKIIKPAEINLETMEPIKSGAEHRAEEAKQIADTPDGIDEAEVEQEEVISSQFDMPKTSMPTVQREVLTRLVVTDLGKLMLAFNTYGDSWKSRGGVGAYMNLARKWDRIEKQCKEGGYDVLEVAQVEFDKGNLAGIMDDIKDLRHYLLLVEAEVTMRHMSLEEIATVKHLAPDTPTGEACDEDCGNDPAEPGPGYVGQ